MKTVLILLSLAFSQLVFSHADHPPKIAPCAAKCTKSEIELAGPLALQFLLDRGMIGKEWSQRKIASTELKQFEKGSEWVLKVNDPLVKEKSKASIYIFITQDGILNGVNYTGK